MTFQDAEELLATWVNLLEAIAATKIDCEMPPDELMDHLNRRQQAIDRIQQLDAPLTEVRQFRLSQPDSDATEILDSLMAKGRAQSDSIRKENSQTIDIASQKRQTILGRLKKTGLTKGYQAANQSLRISEEIDWKYQLMNIYNLLGPVFFYTGEFEQGQQY